jgi:hypothetical protein
MGRPNLKVGGCAKRSASKKKNAGVGVDFKRVKAKVGKKLRKAQNETDVSFKSAVINLPSQSVQADKEGVAVNFQNLSLQVRDACGASTQACTLPWAGGLRSTPHACRHTSNLTPMRASFPHRTC